MKVLLINPPYTSSKYKFIGLVAPPLGIAYIAAVLENGGFEVEILDGAALELDWEGLEARIKKADPQVIAITALTPTIDQGLESAKLARRACPDATIVMGGYHPSFNHAELLKKDYVDVVVIGEGEYTMLDLVGALESGRDLKKVPGIAYQDVVTPPRPVVKDLDQMEIQVEVTPEFFSDRIKELEDLQAKLGHAVENTLGIRAKVSLVEPHTIARSEGKARRVRDEREF